MKRRLIAWFVIVIAICVSAPAFAQTVPPASNQQTNNPQLQTSAQSANVNTQINNTNVGQNSFAPGVECGSPQIAVNGYSTGLSGTFGSGMSSNGISVGYITPVGRSNRVLCEKLAQEIVHQRQLDTQLTIIQRCVDLAKLGVVLTEAQYPELAKACSGVQLAAAPPLPAAPAVTPPATKRLSNFSPAQRFKIVYGTRLVDRCVSARRSNVRGCARLRSH
ncbi:MAG: hypothetical protein M3126_12695 [Candidatus Eremiobacteraeota bacterium]|nr:hypothetical protein [Candidatus Eremiobacteraeota bacterium]